MNFIKKQKYGLNAQMDTD